MIKDTQDRVEEDTGVRPEPEDVLAVIQRLTERLWAQYGDVLTRPRDQEEVHMTYYVGELLKQRGHAWFKVDGIEGACYTEKAMQDAFTAGRRIGLAEGLEQVDEKVKSRIAQAHEALDNLIYE